MAEKVIVSAIFCKERNVDKSGNTGKSGDM